MRTRKVIVVVEPYDALPHWTPCGKIGLWLFVCVAGIIATYGCLFLLLVAKINMRKDDF